MRVPAQIHSRNAVLPLKRNAAPQARRCLCTSGVDSTGRRSASRTTAKARQRLRSSVAADLTRRQLRGAAPECVAQAGTVADDACGAREASCHSATSYIHAS